MNISLFSQIISIIQLFDHFQLWLMCYIPTVVSQVIFLFFIFTFLLYQKLFQLQLKYLGMKNSRFRIKNFNYDGKLRKIEQQSIQNPRSSTPLSSLQHHQSHSVPSQNQKNETLNSMNQFFNDFKNLLLNFDKRQKGADKRDDLEVRDRHYILKIPQGRSYIEKKESIKKWVGKMVSNIVSIAFNYYSNDQMTYQQAKIYCSENILKNIAALNHKYRLTGSELNQIDDYIRDEVFGYLLKKYPMTESIIISRPLEAAALAPNETEKLTNDFLNYGTIRFELRDNQNYDDLIKQLVNDIIYRINLQSKVVPNLSNFNAFQKVMSRMFELVEYKEWMQLKITDSISHTQQLLSILVQDSVYESLKQMNSSQDDEEQNKKREYREKVKEYTNYLIGRKISENINSFSNEQLKMKNIQIKSPGILRIMTKWCEQLWEKFIPKNYYLNKTEDFKLISGEIKSLSPQMRSQLDKLMQVQKAEIKRFMAKIIKENYDVQLNLLNQLLQNSEEQFWEEDLEKISGKFSVLVGKSLEKWVIKYLNRLIHGLLRVAHQFHQQCLISEWPSPPNLITFRIGDLLRCKCASGQRQILRIFQQIKCLSDQKPQVMKIIRIKNRLNLGTNDILINVRFSDLVVCEIQLAVNTRKSKFIKSSNSFTHYLYQVQRSLFGPVNELCSIWRNLDVRSSYYNKNIGRQLGQARIAEHKCETQNRSFQFQVFDNPFICNICNTTYSDNTLILKHLKCSECAFWKCGKCQIHLTSAEQLANKIIQDSKLRPYCTKKYEKKFDSEEFPFYGIAIRLNDTLDKKPLIFKKILVRGVNYLFTLEKDAVVLLVKLINEKIELNFLNEFLIYEVNELQGKKLIQLDELRVRQEYFLASHIKDCYKQHKTSINLENQPMTSEICSTIFEGTENERQNITNIQLKNVNINQIKPLNELFPCLEQLELQENLNLVQFSCLNDFKRLKCLRIKHMLHLSQIPLQICELKQLQILELQNNDFQTIPEQIRNLTHLKQFNISRLDSPQFQNCIRVLPLGLYKLIDLQKLDVSYQFICQLHEDIKNLTHLKFLNIKRNGIQLLPDSINQLTQLQFFDFSENPIEKFPQNMGNLQKLQRFQLKQFGKDFSNIMGDEIYQSSIKQLPMDLQQIQNLVIIDIHSQNLHILPSLKKCTNLQEINLIRCSLEVLPELGNCSKLKKMNLKQQMNYDQNIQLKHLPQQFIAKLSNLQYLCASFNSLQDLPCSLGNLTKLTQISLEYNNIVSLPEQIGLCISLNKINLWHNKLTKLPTSISNLHNLQSLIVYQNDIAEFSESLTKCIGLRFLNLSNNKIQFLHKNIKNLANIENLNLSDNLIEMIPSQLKFLKNIKVNSLGLKNNPIYFIECPEFIAEVGSQATIRINDRLLSKEFQLRSNSSFNHLSSNIKYATALKIIDINNNQFKELPQQMRQLQNLQQIKFDYNKFEVFPTVITFCKNLKVISCQNNVISELPAEIGNLKVMTKLNACYNKINSINQNICLCQNLTELYLSNNLLQKITPHAFKGLNQLYKLSLIGNKFANFPSEILKCLSLQELYLASNEINAIDGDFSQMKKLRFLVLNKNKIMTFPECLAFCPALEELNLNNNQISEIPQKIEEFKSLKILELSFNKITVIPKSISKFKELTTLNLACNSIKIVITELSCLMNMHHQRLNLYNNPLQKIQCMEWIAEKGTWATVELANKVNKG